MSPTILDALDHLDAVRDLDDQAARERDHWDGGESWVHAAIRNERDYHERAGLAAAQLDPATLAPDRRVTFRDLDADRDRTARYVRTAPLVSRRTSRTVGYALVVEHVGGAEGVYPLDRVRDVRPADPLPTACATFDVDPATAARRVPRCRCGLPARLH